jgi:SAM-dependent methyltransferase
VVEDLDRCAACDATNLLPRFQVAGEMGPDGLIPTTDRFGTALADIVRCQRCGHMQLHPMPSPELLQTGYASASSDDYVEEEAGQRATAARTLELIEAHAHRRGALLDVGCWVGFLLAEAGERGWDRTLGIEPSEFASRYARERLGLEVVRGDLFSAELPEGEFDAIAMGDVVEHLPAPGEALARLRSLLNPGGVLWLALPDAGSAVTRGSIARLLDRSGFELLETRTAPKAFTVGYYLGRVGGYSPPAGHALQRAAGALGVAERIWAPDFRDRMAVLARRAA